MKKLILIILTASIIYAFGASGSFTELQPLTAGSSLPRTNTLSKDAILTEIEDNEGFMKLAMVSISDMQKKFTSPHVYAVFKAHAASNRRKEELLKVAAHARTENWGQGYIDAIDELLKETPACILQ